jgi:hypothetical protein
VVEVGEASVEKVWMKESVEIFNRVKRLIHAEDAHAHQLDK